MKRLLILKNVTATNIFSTWSYMACFDLALGYVRALGAKSIYQFARNSCCAKKQNVNPLQNNCFKMRDFNPRRILQRSYKDASDQFISSPLILIKVMMATQVNVVRTEVLAPPNNNVGVKLS